MGAGNIAEGLMSGTPTGYASAGLSAANMAAKNGVFGSTTPGVSGGLGAASGLLGAYEGFKQGGAVGDTMGSLDAASAAAQVGTMAGSSTAASLAPMLGGAATGVGAFAAMYGIGSMLNNMMNGPNNNWSIGTINNLLKTVQAGNPNDVTVNGNGVVTNNANSDAMTALTQLQNGSFGSATSYIDQQLNSMGYMSTAQQVALQGGYIPTHEGGGGMGGEGDSHISKA
jgi:hypothetical protein